MPEPGAPRGVEVLFQTFTPTLPSIAVALRPEQLLAQALEFLLLGSDQLVACVRRGMGRLLGHARFMADSREKYKYKFVSGVESPAK